jgi:hypothetical protein
MVLYVGGGGKLSVRKNSCLNCQNLPKFLAQTEELLHAHMKHIFKIWGCYYTDHIQHRWELDIVFGYFNLSCAGYVNYSFAVLHVNFIWGHTADCNVLICV